MDSKKRKKRYSKDKLIESYKETAEGSLAITYEFEQIENDIEQCALE